MENRIGGAIRPRFLCAPPTSCEPLSATPHQLRAEFEARATTAEASLATMREALEQIAAFNDKQASERLAQTGSYASFDEPGSVEIARRALGGSNAE